MLSGYILSAGPPSTIRISHASRLANIQDVTVSGILLANQVVRWSSRELRLQVSLGKHGGRYSLEQDGSLVLCVGVRSHRPHVFCRFSDGAAWLSRINRSIGKKIVVAGFLRCSLDSPGFREADNARIFEINPVRVLELAGELQSIELATSGIPVLSWTSELNDADELCEVQYWKGSDTLAFSHIDLQPHAYVQLSGMPIDIKLNTGTNRPVWFRLKSSEASRQVRVSCLQGTRAASQIRSLGSARVHVVGLRSLDLVRALEDRYRVNLLAFDIQPV